jgi:pleckstrin homology domain-containing family M member 2
LIFVINQLFLNVPILGRAWLYHSLNEGSLEGYLRTFTREGNLLGKHYFKYALMRDEQRRDLLLGLLASIQDISFDLALV